MKMFILGMFVMVLLVGVLFAYLHRTGIRPAFPATAPDDAYLKGLRETAAQAAVPPNPDTGQDWIMKIRECFGDFSVTNLTRTISNTYASTFYFRDAFHQFERREDLESYLLHSAETTPGVTFTYARTVWSGYDAYLPWTMHVPSGRTGGSKQASLGMSHLRFDADGKVIFHQDYWDSGDVLIPRVPVANGLIELVRRRF